MKKTIQILTLAVFSIASVESLVCLCSGHCHDNTAQTAAAAITVAAVEKMPCHGHLTVTEKAEKQSAAQAQFKKGCDCGQAAKALTVYQPEKPTTLNLSVASASAVASRFQLTVFNHSRLHSAGRPPPGERVLQLNRRLRI